MRQGSGASLCFTRVRLRLTALWVSLLAAMLPLTALSGSAPEEAGLWAALRSGEHFVIMRHAIAPGTGDPKNFALGDCSTQRNLSPQGRAQARRIGARLREMGVAPARVYTSQWCRARETAELLQVGAVHDLAALNSFFSAGDKGDPQTRTLTQWLREQNLARAIVLVTHQVNVTALSGVYPASGEMVVMRRLKGGQLQVVGTLRAG